MALASSSSAPNFSGILYRKRSRSQSQVLLQIHDCNKGSFPKCHQYILRLKSAKAFHVNKGVGVKCNSYVGRNHQQFSYDDDFGEDPFWSNLIKRAFWAIKSLLKFLVEQPSQLKYIEWPSFQSTLKTATLTLVLVGLLIVALSSVDSALSFLLALYLRRSA